MHACTPADAHPITDFVAKYAMAEWSIMDREWLPDDLFDPYAYSANPFYQEKPPLSEYYPPPAQQYVPLLPPPPPPGPPQPPPPSPTLSLLMDSSNQPPPTPMVPIYNEYAVIPRGDNPREIRNKAEKQRRDKLNNSITELASMVPPVVAANRKIDKTGILRLTAHYLRAHQYVFGDSIGSVPQDFGSASAQAILSLLNGFLLTTTYRGLIVVVSQNVQQYLGHAELDLLGQNVFNLIHKDDHGILKKNLMPKSHLLGLNGELLVPEGLEGAKKISEELSADKRRFVVRFKKHGQRSEPTQYVSCLVEGTFRKSDRACRGYNRCCQVVRRARAKGDNPCSSGNDVVFIGVVRPAPETFITESNMEAYRMEYRTRHSIDGQIMECEQRISLVAGYMTHEVHGANAMNFMHKDDVRWVVFALREMYSQHRRVGESCYRLMAKNGQFIYLKTVGVLDVDEDSRAARSFVCTNTVVDEQQGKHLIHMMKKKFMMAINNNEIPPPQEIETDKDSSEEQSVPVEDPRNIENVILQLVSNLPSTNSEDSRSIPPDNSHDPNSIPLAIIPPKKERILSGIEKIYTVIKTFRRESSTDMDKGSLDSSKNEQMPVLSQNSNKTVTKTQCLSRIKTTQNAHLYFKKQMEGMGDSQENSQSLFHYLRPYGTLQTISSVQGESQGNKQIIIAPYVPQNFSQTINPPQEVQYSASGFQTDIITTQSPIFEMDTENETSPVIGHSSALKRPMESNDSETRRKKINIQSQEDEASFEDITEFNAIFDLEMIDDRALASALSSDIGSDISVVLDQEVESILNNIEVSSADADQSEIEPASH